MWNPLQKCRNEYTNGNSSKSRWEKLSHLYSYHIYSQSNEDWWVIKNEDWWWCSPYLFHTRNTLLRQISSENCLTWNLVFRLSWHDEVKFFCFRPKTCFLKKVPWFMKVVTSFSLGCIIFFCSVLCFSSACATCYWTVLKKITC